MKTRIILPLDEGLTEQEKYDVKQLLVDALAEYHNVRYPPPKYVQMRYGTSMSEKQQHAKVAEVMRRLDLSLKLKHAAHDVIIAEAEEGVK